MHDERRATSRLELETGLPGEISVMAPATVRDICRSGLNLESAFPLLVGSLHDLRLHLDDDVVVVKARVVHCQIADVGRDAVTYRAGLEFVGLADHVRASLEAFVGGCGRSTTTHTP